MTTHFAPCAAAVAAAAGTLCPIARAQPVVGAEVKVSVIQSPGGRNGEPVIVASTHNPDEVLVAWISWPTFAASFLIHYRVSTTGFLGTLTPDEPSSLPFPNAMCQSCALAVAADPAAARSRTTGDLFLGALFSGEGGRALGIARKPLGAAGLEGNPPIVRQIAPCLADIDRPSMAAGPTPPGESPATAPDVVYFTYHIQQSGQPEPRPMYSARSIAASPIGSAWACQPTTPPSNNGHPALITSGPQNVLRNGVGNPGVVIHSGARAGRLIVASCAGEYITVNPPETTWTDEGGGPVLPGPPEHNPWTQFRSLDAYGPPNPTSPPIAGVRLSGSGLPVPSEIPVPADIALQFKSAPSIATDPGNPSEVYIAFIGRSLDEPNQIHIFIAWTDTGNLLPPPFNDGPRFQGQAPGAGWDPDHRRTHRILDSRLVAPGDPPLSTHQAEQFLPTIVIDDLGGINLLYCQAFECVGPGCESPAPTTHFTTRYARWPSRAALEAGEAPFLRVLHAPSERWGDAAGHDYLGLTSAGCLVYAAWARKDTDGWHVYVSRIALPCPADADSSGTIDTLDPITFAGQFAAQQPEADVNQDGLVNPQDYSDFMAAYACGACPIP